MDNVWFLPASGTDSVLSAKQLQATPVYDSLPDGTPRVLIVDHPLIHYRPHEYAADAKLWSFCLSGLTKTLDSLSRIKDAHLDIPIVIACSSASIYGERCGMLTESDDLMGTDFLSAFFRMYETLVSEIFPVATLLRPFELYDSAAPSVGLLTWMAVQARFGAVWPEAGNTLPISSIRMSTFATFIRELCHRGFGIPGPVNVADPVWTPFDQLREALELELQVPADLPRREISVHGRVACLRLFRNRYTFLESKPVSVVERHA